MFKRLISLLPETWGTKLPISAWFNYNEITTMDSKQKAQNENRKKRQIVNYEELPTFPQNLVYGFCVSLMPEIYIFDPSCANFAFS